MNRKHFYTGMISLLFLSLLSCSIRHSEPLTGRTVDATNVRIHNGQLLYQRYCDRCHPGGEAGLGPEVTGKPGFARRLQTRHGLGVMPSFKMNEISKAEMNDMMVYLNHQKRLK